MNELQDGDEIIGKIDAHMDILVAFLWGVHQGLIPSSRFDPNPDDIELRDFSREYHSKRSTTPIGTARTVSTGSVLPSGGGGGHHGNIEILTSALT